jgi:hypothetical protein
VQILDQRQFVHVVGLLRVCGQQRAVSLKVSVCCWRVAVDQDVFGSCLVCLFVCRAVWASNVGCRFAAQCKVSDVTAAVLCRFIVGNLPGVNFDWDGCSVCTDRLTDMAKLVGGFCGLERFAVNAPVLFLCAFISARVLFDVRTTDHLESADLIRMCLQTSAENFNVYV